jgi:cell division initiation protein
VSERRRVPAELRSVAFPVAVRGYDRRAVDAYVTRVNRLIAELEATRSPERAVERALMRTERQRSRILDEARDMAADINTAAQHEAGEIRGEAVAIVVNANAAADRTKTEADEYVAKAKSQAERILAESRSEAADRLQQAQVEIEALREEAEAWMRALRTDTNVIWGERRDLLADLRDLAARLHEAASHSAARADSRDGCSV